MPTVSEPVWTETAVRIERIKLDFINGVDTEAVLSARLFGAGLRGQDLDAEIVMAKYAKLDKHHMKPEPMNVLVMERDGKSTILRFINAEAAGVAVKLLRKQPNILFASRVRANHVQPNYVAGLYDCCSNEQFVTSMLAHL